MARRADARKAEAANREFWEDLARVHLESYREVGMLRRGEEILDPVEVSEVGDVRGKTLLHLQCHIGTDTLAWARHGAIVTGVDFSAEAVRCATRLRDELRLDARFIEANVYDVPKVLGEEFDLVYSSRGVLCWLSDMEEWARVVARSLRPGGSLYLLDSHPILNALEERPAGLWSFEHPYFHEVEPTRWAAGGPDYSDPTHMNEHSTLEWAWALSEIVSAVLAAGLRLELLHEHEHGFFRHFPSMTADDGRTFRVPGHAGRLPLLFSLRARR
jgi:SAM-dependent methyltransferase